MESSNANIKYGYNCTICSEIELVGDITICNGTIIHPRVRIIAEAGPIIIGENNIIEENVVIWNKASGDATGSTPVMIIGNFNVFEVGSSCHALKVGDNNIFEAKSHVGREVVVTYSCVIGAACSLLDSETLPEHTSIFGKNKQRIITQGPQHSLLLMETLAKLLPMGHKTMKKKFPPSS